MFDFVLLLVAGICQLALGALGLRVSTRPPKKTERGRYELAFWAIGLVGLSAIVWSGIRTTNVQDAIKEGVNKILAHFEEEQPKSEKFGVFAECKASGAARPLSADGRAYFVMLQNSLANQNGGGLGYSFGGGTVVQNQLMYECQVVNDSRSVLFNVNCLLSLTIMEALGVEGQPNAKRVGSVIAVRYWNVPIPRIEKEGSFSFYIIQMSNFFVDVAFPTEVTLQIGASEKERSVPLVTPQQQKINLAPARFDEKP